MEKRFYARMLGRISWHCPNCKAFNEHKINKVNWWLIRCRNRKCKALFTLGLRFYRVCHGTRTRTPPFDTVLIGDIHPEVWRRGQPVNAAIDNRSR